MSLCDPRYLEREMGRLITLLLVPKSKQSEADFMREVGAAYDAEFARKHAPTPR